MGLKNVNRLAVADWRASHPTVRLMRLARWQVFHKCPSCGARGTLNLAEVELELGPGFTLWGRAPRCRTFLCKARVRLSALPPHVDQPFSLSDQPRLPSPPQP